MEDLLDRLSEDFTSHGNLRGPTKIAFHPQEIAGLIKGLLTTMVIRLGFSWWKGGIGGVGPLDSHEQGDSSSFLFCFKLWICLD